jgi:hypothetical protein
VLAQQNGNVSDKRYEADNASDDVFFAGQEGLAGGVEFGVVCEIVVALGQEAEGCFAENRVSLSMCKLSRVSSTLPNRSSRRKAKKAQLTLLRIFSQRDAQLGYPCP